MESNWNCRTILLRENCICTVKCNKCIYLLLRLFQTNKCVEFSQHIIKRLRLATMRSIWFCDRLLRLSRFTRRVILWTIVLI